MPRYIVNESEDESELKTGRRTRATLAATVTDSPIRRSTRIRHGSVNPDGSSPESITGAAQLTRVTRRRAVAATTETTTANEPPRALRSRKNSVSSNVSENPELEFVPNTPKARAIKRLSIVQSSPNTPKLGTRTRRSIRASSETKSPPSVTRTTRRTRASSIDPEPTIVQATKDTAATVQSITSVDTPTKKRRQQVSVLPSEPALPEDDNEENVFSEIHQVVESIPEEEMEDEDSPDQTLLKFSRGSSSASPQKLSLDDSLKDHSNAEMEIDESSEISPTTAESMNEKVEESEPWKKSPVQIEVDVSTTDIEAQDSTKPLQSSLTKTKHHSLDKSKQLGRKIEDLLNKSAEEQESSPGNKENQKLINISPEKIKKNLEFTVSNVNIVRGKSLGSAKLMNKSSDRKMNHSLDEQVLSKSRYDIVTPKSTEVENNRLGNTSQDSNSEKKSQTELPSAVEASEENQDEELQEAKIKNNLSSANTLLPKLDETVMENEAIEEFTLYDSNDSLYDSKSELSLNIDESVKNKKKNESLEKSNIEDASNKRSSLTKSIKSESDEHSDAEIDPNSSCKIFEKPNPSKNSSHKNSIGDSQGKKHNSPTKRYSLSLTEFGDCPEISKIGGDKQDKRRQSTENKEFASKHEESKLKDKISADHETKDLENEKNSSKIIDDDEQSMGTNEHDEKEANESSVLVSPEKRFADRHLSLIDEKSNYSNVENSKGQLNSRASDSDSNITIENLFHNISAEEWNKEKNSPKKSNMEKKASPRGWETLLSDLSQESERESDSEDDRVFVIKSSLKEYTGAEASDSDATLVLKNNDSAKKAKKKRKSDDKIIVEEAENENSEIAETVDARKSLNKSVKSNTSMGDKTNNEIEKEEEEEEEEASNENSVADSREEGMEVDDNLSEIETIPRDRDDPASLKDTNSVDEDAEEEKLSVSSKNTPKNEKKKSPSKSGKKSKKSADVDAHENSSVGKENNEAFNESTDEDEKKISVSPKTKSPQKRTSGFILDKLKTPIDKNYSMVAVVDSDSGPENVTDPDCANSDTDDNIMPRYFFDSGSSNDENENEDSMEDETNNTIDTDISKEMNLAGNDDVEYSDDNVSADDCRVSESEHSDEEDQGSDMDSFIIADDDVESSDYSEEESEIKKFKRILANSSSEGEEQKETKTTEENHGEETDESDEDETKDREANEKQKRKSFCITPNHDTSLSKEESAMESPELRKTKLNFSFEFDKVSPSKKTKRGKNVQDLSGSEFAVSPTVEDVEKSNNKLKKFSKSIKSLSDTTIDLCTPEHNAKVQVSDIRNQSPGLNTSLNEKSAKKLRKNLVEDLGPSTPNEANVTQEAEESTVSPKTRTPKKKVKTPKSARKNQRDSMQLIEETALVKSNVSDLNKSMLTPNSESPVTKFLKKEKLNESLPLLEMKKRASKMFDRKSLSKMNEEQEMRDNSQRNYGEKSTEESDEPENYVDDNVEKNDEKIGDNGHEDDGEKDDETDKESNKEEENEDLKEKNEDEEEEETSEEEISVKKKKKKKSPSTAVEEPKIERIVKYKKSSGKKNSIEIEDKNKITQSKKQSAKEQSTTSISGVVYGKDVESKEDTVTPKKKRSLSNPATELLNKNKRTRLESSDTPIGLIKTKKIKISSMEDTNLAVNSDSDEAPETLGFSDARTEALREMKNVTASLKAAKEAKKKKRRDQLERIRQEKNAKAIKKGTLHEKSKPEQVKNNLKRLPEDLLDNLSDIPQRPKKKQKLAKKEEPMVPSKYMFSPGKSPKSSLRIEDYKCSVSTGGGTTQFSVVNLEKVKKQPKKAAAIASFRDIMLSRNPRQPVSAFLMYQAKQKASGKQLFSRKQA